MSNPNRRGALALVSASLCLTLAALFYFADPAPALTASAPAAVPAAADWGLSFPTEGESPVGNATEEALAQYGAYYLGDTGKKVLYLTFDCGYENGYTEAILDALKKHNAPAAFFVVGHMIESAPDIVRRMAEEGHIVGNHTFHHPDMSSISDLTSFQKELTDLETLYQETTGQPLSKFYRPPQGKYSVENLKQAQQLGTPPSSGAWPTWTGTRTHSPRWRKPMPSCCPASTMGPLCCSTPPPPPMPPFWTTC